MFSLAGALEDPAVSTRALSPAGCPNPPGSPPDNTDFGPPIHFQRACVCVCLFVCACVCVHAYMWMCFVCACVCTAPGLYVQHGCLEAWSELI